MLYSVFFRDFSSAFSRLVALGCPAAQPKVQCPKATERERVSAEFREYAMHGSLEHMKRLQSGDRGVLIDPNAVDADSGRSALHKAAFWGHDHVIKMLLQMGVAVSLADFAGDTALHDAARFGHASIVRQLLGAGADLSLPNKDGLTPLALAREHGKDDIANVLVDCASQDAAVAAASRRKGFLGSSPGF